MFQAGDIIRVVPGVPVTGAGHLATVDAVREAGATDITVDIDGIWHEITVHPGEATLVTRAADRRDDHTTKEG